MIDKYLETHYSIKDPLIFKKHPWFEPLKMSLMHLQNRMSSELSNVDYAVDKLGLDMYLSFEKNEQYITYKNTLSEDVIYLFANQFDYSDEQGYILIPKIVAIFTDKEISGFNQPIFGANTGKYKIYKIKNI